MPALATDEPAFGRVVHHLNSIINRAQRSFYPFSPAESWSPPVNLYETEAAYEVCVDLAGVDRDAIDLTVSGNHLQLRGKRPIPTPRVGANPPRLRIHVMEIDHGNFHREVELPPDADGARITAEYREGMLWIEIPRKADEPR